MKTVKVRKSDLITKLHENRTKHYEDYQHAFQGYIIECLSILKEKTKEFKKDPPPKNLYISETAPKSHVKDYDRALAMLEMSIDDIVEISAQEFAQFVQDDWEWKKQWTVSNAKYSGYTQLGDDE